ncbi:MAG: transposase [Gammaproteobacteria bacterium]|nr:transposase [Gammaproteobacteria bacterium]
MPKPRKTLVSLDATPYYHCVSRCVRRAFLCGMDPHTGQSFEHRRLWIQNRIIRLADIFAVDVCAYAVMSNHVHVVLHVDREMAAGWTVHEVTRRWSGLFPGNSLAQRFLAGEVLSKSEHEILEHCARDWRYRLTDISWFMRCLNEPIARRANQEDDCTGRFWEGRFKSQALLDEKALIACMSYVDLNPLRAGMTTRAESADFTSVQARIVKAHTSDDPNDPHNQPRELMPFVDNSHTYATKGLPMPLNDYLDLVNWTGRAIIQARDGAYPDEVPPTLKRLHIEPEHWLYMAQYFESRFKGLVGAAHTLKAVCKRLGYHRTPSLRACTTLLT